MVQEFYANAWITKNHDQSVNPDPKNYLTMVRGKYLDFSPESVRLAFNLPMMQGDEHPYTRRVNFDQRLDQVLTVICEEGAQWKQDSRGKPVQLLIKVDPSSVRVFISLHHGQVECQPYIFRTKI